MKHTFSALGKGEVDKQKGIIYAVSLIEMGVAKGHNLLIDMVTLQQVTEKSKVYNNGLKVKLNHGSGVDAICGRITNIRVLGEKVVGDFHLLKNHPRFDLILEMADTQPDTFGMSVAFQGTPEAIPTGLAARVDEIFSCDLVCEPAATEALFESKVDTEKSVMGTTNYNESKGAESTEKPEKDTKVGEESVMMGRIDALEARLKSFEEAVLSAKEDESDEEEESEGEKSEMGSIDSAKSTIKTAIGGYKKAVKRRIANFPPKLGLESAEVNIQELVQQEIVKQFSALGTQVPPTPSVAVEKKEEPKAPTFFELVDGEVKGGKSRSQAVEFVVAKHPEAHMSYLESIGIYKK
jgi:hypothetical protein